MQSLRVTVPDSAVGGGAAPGKDPLGAISAPAPVLPKAAARPPDPASAVLGLGPAHRAGQARAEAQEGRLHPHPDRLAEGRPHPPGGAGLPRQAWRQIAATRLTRSSRITIRFRDRGFLGIRIRSTSPGTNRFVVSRVLKVPKVKIAKR